MLVYLDVFLQYKVMEERVNSLCVQVQCASAVC